MELFFFTIFYLFVFDVCLIKLIVHTLNFVSGWVLKTILCSEVIYVSAFKSVPEN